jgi:hypothetical protein
MHSILLVAERPPSKSPEKRDHAKSDSYETFVKALQDSISKNTNIEALAENVLLISIDSTLEPLSEVIRNLSDVPYKYTIFDEKLEWHAVKGEA